MKFKVVNFKGKREKQILLAAAAVIAVLLGFLAARGDPDADRANASHESSERAVVARGRIEPLSRVRTVQGTPGAIIHKLAAREGDTVKTGDVLAELDTRPALLAAVAMEEKRLEEAERQLVQVRAPAKQSDIEAQKAVVEKLRVEAQRLTKEFQRGSELVSRNAISVETLDARRAAMEQASHALTQAEWALRSLREPRDEDVKVAAARVATQKDAVAKIRAELDLTQIRAPIDGTILTLMVREGESLGTEGLLQIGDLANLIVIAEVDESDIGRVAVGRTARITGPSLTAPVAGTVTRVSNAVFKQKRPTSDVLIGRDARIIEVEITPEVPLPPVVWGEVAVAVTGAP